MPITNIFMISVMTGLLLPYFAHAGINQHQHIDQQISHQHAVLADNTESYHDHQREHGGQIYQVTHLENAWSVDEDAQDTYSTQLKSMIGTDEHRLYLKAHLTKSESADTAYQVSAFYSRMLTDFWDIQAGLRYGENRTYAHDKQVDAVFGWHGLAPYFFESDIHLYVGEHEYVALGLSFERDILLTQKLITQPYIEMDIVLHDDAIYAVKTGLSELKTGLKTRYEINKRIKPFIDIGYDYERGQAVTNVQQHTVSESKWQYGLGLELLF